MKHGVENKVHMGEAVEFAFRSSAKSVLNTLISGCDEAGLCHRCMVSMLLHTVLVHMLSTGLKLAAAKVFLETANMEALTNSTPSTTMN